MYSAQNNLKICTVLYKGPVIGWAGDKSHFANNFGDPP